MINKILKSIASAIYAEFGAGYEIYIEDIPQGLKAPCFFIMAVSPSDQMFLGLSGGNQRRKLSNLFSVQYFPSAESFRQECNDVEVRLNRCLEEITVDGSMLRGTDPDATISDGVLVHTVNYNFFGKSTVSGTDMQTIKIEGEINE